MRASEFIIETTTSGSVATVSMPVGEMQKRTDNTYKYNNTRVWMNSKDKKDVSTKSKNTSSK